MRSQPAKYSSSRMLKIIPRVRVGLLQAQVAPPQGGRTAYRPSPAPAQAATRTLPLPGMLPARQRWRQRVGRMAGQVPAPPSCTRTRRPAAAVGMPIWPLPHSKCRGVRLKCPVSRARTRVLVPKLGPCRAPASRAHAYCCRNSPRLARLRRYVLACTRTRVLLSKLSVVAHQPRARVLGTKVRMRLYWRRYPAEASTESHRASLPARLPWQSLVN